MTATVRLASLTGPRHCVRHMPPQQLPWTQQLAFTSRVTAAVVELMRAGVFDPTQRACCQLGDSVMDAIARTVPGVWALRS